MSDESVVEPAHPLCSEGYFPPKRVVHAIFDMAKWYRSEAYQNFMEFMHRINDSVICTPTYAQIHVSDRVRKVISVLDNMENWISEFPLEDMIDQRFGNKTYRKWNERLKEQAEPIVLSLLPEAQKEAKVELIPYLLDSFGNATRIDYGSGHEAAFLMFLYCLYSTGALVVPDDDQATVLRIFADYLRLCRKLQSTYRMEPAGSRGVHAIDDYQFAPFIFGSAQLIKNRQRLIPDHYLNPNTVASYRNDNLFFEAVHFINETKFGPFYEHSNQLYNISGVPNWEKVNSGMFKMYEGECLKKFPVAQHFVFGSILSANQRPIFSQRDAETKAALAKEREEDEKKKAEQSLLDRVQPMDMIEED